MGPELSGSRAAGGSKDADAIETIGTVLAENAGMDPIDTQVELRARHSKGEKWAGVDALSGKVADMWSKSVIEPMAVKSQILKAATESACMILRIDDVIAANKAKEPAGVTMNFIEYLLCNMDSHVSSHSHYLPRPPLDGRKIDLTPSRGLVLHKDGGNIIR